MVSFKALGQSIKGFQDARWMRQICEQNFEKKNHFAIE